MDIIKTLSLDFQELEAKEGVNVKKSDAGRVIRLLLFDGGTPYAPGDGAAALVGRRPSGAVCYEECQVDGSTLYYRLSPRLALEEGEVSCEVKLLFPDGRRISGPGFFLQVDPTIWEGDQPVETPPSLTRVLLAPKGCQAGQYLRIAEVDPQGDALGLEPVNTFSGYYALSVTQETPGEMTLTLTPSEDWMPRPEKVRVSLPAGDRGEKGDKGDKGDRGDRGVSGLVPSAQVDFSPAITLPSNAMTRIAPLTGAVALTLGAPQEGYDNEWDFTLTQGDTAYDVSLPVIRWGLGIAPSFSANSTTVCRLYRVGDILCGEWVTV